VRQVVIAEAFGRNAEAMHELLHNWYQPERGAIRPALWESNPSGIDMVARGKRDNDRLV
jgi:hypothetical protein